MKQSPGYYSFPGPDVVGSGRFGRGLPARSSATETGRAGAPPSDPRDDRGSRRAPGADVVDSTHLGGPDPARPLDHEASRAGAAPPIPGSLFREMPEAAWLLVEAITAKAPPKPAFGSSCNNRISTCDTTHFA